jgi:SAM-dependent methyltransferase
MNKHCVYDTIGCGYALNRRAEPRIARQILDALGDSATVVNVGAGTGSYEPRHLAVTAVEPSIEMIAQRPPGAAPVVRAIAEQLPFADHSFDASLAVLTVHHWRDPPGGLAEMRRVARRRVVILTWDVAAGDSFWLTAHYFPEITAFDSGRFGPIDELADALGAKVIPVPVPRDCQDGFLAAFWARPEEYLDPRRRAAMSGFAQIPPRAIESGLEQLARDLRAGVWDRQFGELRTRESLDVGYRLLIADTISQKDADSERRVVG